MEAFCKLYSNPSLLGASITHRSSWCVPKTGGQQPAANANNNSYWSKNEQLDYWLPGHAFVSLSVITDVMDRSTDHNGENYSATTASIDETKHAADRPCICVNTTSSCSSCPAAQSQERPQVRRDVDNLPCCMPYRLYSQLAARCIFVFFPEHVVVFFRYMFT